MQKMSFLDAYFLRAETPRTPMHVGGLSLFTLPKGVDETEFLDNLSDTLDYDGELRRPFGKKLKMGPLGVAGNIYWQEDDDPDMAYHIRRSALPKPGRYRELFALVSRLHGTLLDRSRPLWEFHIIEGLQNRQFAIYFKAHHCAIDGMAAMHLMNSMYSSDHLARVTESPFSEKAYLAYREKLKNSRDSSPKEKNTRATTDALKAQLGSAVSFGKAVAETTGTWLGRQSKIEVAFHDVPDSALSTQLTAARRFVAQSWSFERLRAVGKAFDGTLNDAILAMCAGALRKQLMAQRGLPKASLKALVPVSVRTAGDLDATNAVGMVIADLATNIRDPAKRMRRIKESMDAAKQQLEQMSAREIQAYGTLFQIPMLVTQLGGLGSRFPAYSTIISNVPGPRKQLYWNGARVDGVYPASIPTDGTAINFTVVSNNNNLDFGIVACRKSTPHVQRLIDYMEDSLVELEDAAGISSQAKGKEKLAPAKRKARSGTKAKPVAKAARVPKAKRKAKTSAKTAQKAKADVEKIPEPAAPAQE